MKYLITGETIESGRKVSPEELAHVLDRGIILNLEAYNNLGLKQKIIPNGTAISKTGVAIVDGESSKDVNSLLKKFPSWLRVKWTVSPLENF